MDDSTARRTRLEQKAAGRQQSLITEFAAFLMHNKKWWLAPILVALAVFGVLLILGGTGAAPFIYTLF